MPGNEVRVGQTWRLTGVGAPMRVVHLFDDGEALLASNVGYLSRSPKALAENWTLLAEPEPRPGTLSEERIEDLAQEIEPGLTNVTGYDLEWDEQVMRMSARAVIRRAVAEVASLPASQPRPVCGKPLSEGEEDFLCTLEPHGPETTHAMKLQTVSAGDAAVDEAARALAEADLDVDAAEIALEACLDADNHAYLGAGEAHADAVATRAIARAAYRKARGTR